MLSIRSMSCHINSKKDQIQHQWRICKRGKKEVKEQKRKKKNVLWNCFIGALRRSVTINFLSSNLLFFKFFCPVTFYSSFGFDYSNIFIKITKIAKKEKKREVEECLVEQGMAFVHFSLVCITHDGRVLVHHLSLTVSHHFVI